jgi:curved DNA-binding protein CbpA
MLETKTLDYYEFLQISPNADFDTIHRIYKFLAARFHPDNPTSGDPEKFFLLKTAYDVLSDPVSRTEYDMQYEREHSEKTPLSDTVDFMDSAKGELNRRLAVLAVLYYKRRTNPYHPEVPLHEIEKRMGFPRDYLDFTTWYLTRKGYITKADNSDFALTAEGVDFVEAQRVNIPVLNKMLTSGSKAAAEDLETELLSPEAESAHELEAHEVEEPVSQTPIPTHVHDRRTNSKDRRSGAPDWRANKLERRKNKDRRMHD